MAYIYSVRKPKRYKGRSKLNGYSETEEVKSLKRQKVFGNRRGQHGKPKAQKIKPKEDHALYKLTREERETIINWCSADNTASVYSADSVVIRKLDRLAAAFPNDYKCTRVDSVYGAKDYIVPTRYIRFGRPASQAQIEAARRNSQVASF